MVWNDTKYSAVFEVPVNIYIFATNKTNLTWTIKNDIFYSSMMSEKWFDFIKFILKAGKF